MKLFISAVTKFLLGVLLVCALLFLPAWTLDYPGAWLFMALLFIPMFIAGIVMLVKNPALLESRLDAKEKEAEQSLVVKLSGLMFLAGFIVCGLDHRFSWSYVPTPVVIGASVMFIVAYVLYAEVLRENTYLSRTVKVREGQKVISTGLYGIVRHPMYFATLLLFLAMPLILGSLWALLIFLMYPFIIVKRLLGEEKVLTRELAGYAEYKEKVKYRLIPFIW
ncbi:MAG: isoprenylcysteine carboxylmethyltransferase family protein [Clostridia bacterium]|nr:isoprenylcysteine carboxylmethyltransferase family protein [Clostridia bacterium]